MKSTLSLTLCVISLLLTLFLAALDIVIVVTLYDTIGIKFHDFGNIGWLVTGYALSNAVFMLLWGRLAEILGTKECLMISVIVFEIGSLISALSNSMATLISGRVVAGFGGSGIESLAFVVGTSIVRENHRGIMITALAISYVIAEGVGPFIGGAFNEHLSWRWCFYINLPIGAFAFIILAFCNTSGEPHQKMWLPSKIKKIMNYDYGELLKASFWKNTFEVLVFKLDMVGIILSSAGFTLLMLGLSFGGNNFPWNSGIIICFFTVGPILLLLFCAYDFHFLPLLGLHYDNKRIKPLLTWNIASNCGIFTSSITGFLSCFAYELQSAYLVQLYQLVFKKKPTLASIHLWELSIPAMIATMAIAYLNSKYGIIKPAIVFGVLCGIVGSGLFTLINGELSQSIGYSILPGIAFGSIFQATLLSSQVQITSDEPDFQNKFIEVTAFNSFAKSLGFAFGGNMGAMIFTASLKNQMRSSQLNIPQFTSVETLLAYSTEHYDGPQSSLSKFINTAIHDVFSAP
ncbi:CLL_HP2_G0033980.mRNA.1.CDS.1 [Saccharomyces cerevisiae]|nr:CLL_HP2_G0033980.mRNA.1.CDS.1 [Saccharomyces cerevisiae]CAI6535534.1 CLL_HP2_G0033980.mRNA.1.CDS.1 [Saccharomyces cerevisiae]